MLYAGKPSRVYSENQAVLSKLVSEVKGLNPSFDAAEMRGVLYRMLMCI